MATTPNFAKDPHNESGVATLAVGNLNTDAPTNLVSIFTATTVATNINSITAQPRGTTASATAAYLFVSKAGVPGVTRLKDSVTVPAQTISASGGITKTYFGDYSETTPLRLGVGETLWGGTGVAQANGIVFNVATSDF